MRTKKKKAKMGRPTRLTEKAKKVLKTMAEKGLTEKEMALCLDIDLSTLTKWKQRHADFFTSLKKWKLKADVEVEKSLFMRAKGFKVPAVHISNYQGDITETPIDKYYPPETIAAIFWLKNRQPDRWRDRKEITGADGGPMQVNLIDYGKLPKEKEK